MTQESVTTPVAKDFVLHFLIRPAAVKTAPQKVLILLHGVGSNEEDLFRFADRFPEHTVISPRGPYTLGPSRYGWYQVDFSKGHPVINEDQQEKSRVLLEQFIGQVRQAYATENVWLGGFSQGAIMSYSVGLTNPAGLKGILALSGRILAETRPMVKRKASALESLPVFIAHGVLDKTLPVGYAREAKEYLQQLGVPISYHEYPIGHQIDDQVLNDISDWLSR